MATTQSVTDPFEMTSRLSAVQIVIDVVDAVVCQNVHFKFNVYLD